MGNNNLLKNALFNSVRRIAGIIFPLISFIYCSRVLGAEVLGIVTYLQSIVSYFVLFAALGISEYAVREGASIRDDKVAVKQFISEVFTINGLTSIIAFVLLAIFVCISDFSAEYKLLLLIHGLQIPLTFFGAEWVNNIYEDYRYLAIRYVLIQVVSLVLMFLFVRSPRDIYQYALLLLFSGCFGYLVNMHHLKKCGIQIKLARNVNAKKHLPTILILFASSLASVIYLNSDITLLGLLSNEQQVGIYTASTRIYTAIKTMINAIVMVTVPRFSYIIGKNDTEEYREELKKIFGALMVIVVPMVIGLFLVSDKVLYLLSGPEYMEGAEAVNILSITIIFAVTACVMSYSILIPNHKEKVFLGATVFAAVVNLGLNFYFIPNFGVNGAAITTLIAEASMSVITVYASRDHLKHTFVMKNAAGVCLSSLSIVMVHIIIDNVVEHVIGSLVITVFLSVIAYAGILILLKNEVIYSIIVRLKQTIKIKTRDA